MGLYVKLVIIPRFLAQAIASLISPCWLYPIAGHLIYPIFARKAWIKDMRILHRAGAWSLRLTCLPAYLLTCLPAYRFFVITFRLIALTSAASGTAMG